MKKEILALSFLFSTISYAGTYNAVIQCRPEGPAFSATVTLPDMPSDWSVTQDTYNNCVLAPKSNVEIEFNGQVFSGTFQEQVYRRDDGCENSWNNSGFGNQGTVLNASIKNQSKLIGSIWVLSPLGKNFTLPKPDRIHFPALEAFCSISY